MRLRDSYLRGVVAGAFLAAIPAGCGSGQLDVPRAVMVNLPDGTEVRAVLGSGVSSLADTQWDLFAVSTTAQGTPFLRIRFNANGSLRSFTDNTFARNILGSTLLFDGRRHATRQFGLEYTAATYGAETSDGQGFGFQARATAFAAAFVEAATARASATATLDPDDPATMRGLFTFAIRVKIGGIPTPPAQEPINFIGQRVTQEDAGDVEEP